jgi:hypothetical protein
MTENKPEGVVDPRDLWFAEWQLVLPRDAREAWPGEQHHAGVAEVHGETFCKKAPDAS